jgi:hypothetical protein
VAAKTFAVGFPKLQANAIYCRQTLFIAGKHINKLQAGLART